MHKRTTAIVLLHCWCFNFKPQYRWQEKIHSTTQVCDNYNWNFLPTKEFSFFYFEKCRFSSTFNRLPLPIFICWPESWEEKREDILHRLVLSLHYFGVLKLLHSAVVGKHNSQFTVWRRKLARGGWLKQASKGSRAMEEKTNLPFRTRPSQAKMSNKINFLFFPVASSRRVISI